MGIRQSSCYKDSTAIRQQTDTRRWSISISRKRSTSFVTPQVLDINSKYDSTIKCGLESAPSPTVTGSVLQSQPTSDCGVSVPFSSTCSSPIVYVCVSESIRYDGNNDEMMSLAETFPSLVSRRLPDLSAIASYSPISGKLPSLCVPHLTADNEESFLGLMEQLFAIIPTGSVSTVIVLLSSFARCLRSEHVPTNYLCKILHEARWYRYRDLPPSPTKSPRASARLSPRPNEASSKDSNYCLPSPEASSLSKMVATDMTVLHIAAMYGHHDIIAFFASLLTVHQLEISEWLNIQDPIFGMTPVHMMVLSHQAESVEALVHLLRDYDLRETANDVSSGSALFAICSIQTTAGKTLLHLLLQEAEVAVWNTVLLSLAQVIRGRRISSAQWLQLWSCQEHNDENSIMHILSLQASLIGMQLLLQHWQQMMAGSEGAIFESNIIKILQVMHYVCIYYNRLYLFLLYRLIDWRS